MRPRIGHHFETKWQFTQSTKVERQPRKITRMKRVDTEFHTLDTWSNER